MFMIDDMIDIFANLPVATFISSGHVRCSNANSEEHFINWIALIAYERKLDVA